MKKIAIITARSGSKGLPNKNVLLVNGKPLIAYSIEAAINSHQFEKIIVTTDSQEYIDLLSHYPIEFVKRSPQLATDTASSFVVIEDVLNRYKNIEFDYFVLLQPTSPLRTEKHIIEANKKFEENFIKFDFLVSVSRAHKPTTLTRPIDNDESLKYFQLDYSNYARQNYKSEYSPNGAIFSAKPDRYLEQKHFYGENSIAFFMDKSTSVDIDDRLDFEYFYFLIQQQKKNEVLINNIKQRIQYKLANFQTIEDISLIGHSILDQWNITSINGMSVNNLAISGISSEEYQKFILDTQILNNIGNIIVLMMGTNDIVKDGWSNQSCLKSIQNIVDTIKILNVGAKIYFLEITPTALRIDRNNQDIRNLNKYLKQHLKSIIWIDLYEQFTDKYGKLDLLFSNDGLHLNQNGYEKLYNILSQELEKNK
ncbi:acylneuraminate cytidylyltransferase [Gallibacterium anatis]|uniref:cytidylyltransferase domain-containing protein n=1 Tax=Gallibacterium anatis TaxID=750 RepID=UPI000530C4FD|nr:GDSL-type esterase/lipase family protein [Gallibacterium anatis]KGQ45299.1 acylneuraminate cytidylyltransferase [Gallibacterium anatis]KGQ51288.1 acylneuraminate cytidylyltransferase [Gallibacterium anatis]KGQ58753.1 acylneuraminate cytidylyltransferase [Gallibacterium anatis]